MRKLLSLIACLAILASILVPPVYAAWPVNGDCDFLDGHAPSHSWVAKYNDNWNSIYAEMYVDPARFQPCTNPGLVEQSDPMEWISLGQIGILNNIVQIGLVECRGGTSGYNCQDNFGVAHYDQLGYFVAWGREANTCPAPYNNERKPVGLWLGPALLGGVPPGPLYRTFQLTRSRVDGHIRFYIDGQQVGPTVTHNEVCWVDFTSSDAEWSVERHDKNDGLGGPGPVYFKNTQAAHDLGSLGAMTFTQSSCTSSGAAADEYICNVLEPQKIGFSTLQHN